MLLSSACPSRSWVNNYLSPSILFLALKVPKSRKTNQSLANVVNWSPYLDLEFLLLYLNRERIKSVLWISWHMTWIITGSDFHQVSGAEVARQSGEECLQGQEKSLLCVEWQVIPCDGSYSAYRVRVGSETAGIDKSQIVKIKSRRVTFIWPLASMRWLKGRQ